MSSGQPCGVVRLIFRITGSGLRHNTHPQSFFRARSRASSEGDRGEALNSRRFLEAVLRTAFLSVVSLVCATRYADAALPAVKALTGTPVSTSNADSWYNGQGGNTHTNKLCTLNAATCSAPRPLAIIALARSLSQGGAVSSDQFATNVFEYVYKNVDTEFRYGLSKGAFGALLDRSGTPFDQANLMVEILKEGALDYPSAYSSLAPAYLAGTVTLDGTEFSAWTGITNAPAACQLLASGGIPSAVNGSTPAQCASLSGTANSVVMSHIWVKATTSAGTRLYDPSYKTYTWKQPADLPTIMGCGTQCGASAVNAAIPSGTTYQGFDNTAGARYAQNIQTGALATTLNGFATQLQHYIEQNAPASGVQDIAGGASIDPTKMPAPSGSLPYDAAPMVQHTWTGNIPDQYRSRLTIQFNNINVTLFADETYGYWLYVSTSISNSQNTEYTTLFFEREKGTAAAVTPNLSQYCDSGSTGCSGNLRSTNEAVPLASTVLANTLENPLTLTANHPYAASATGSTPDGTYADDTITTNFGYQNVVLPNASNIFGYLLTGPSFYVIQSWGKSGKGMVARMSTMSDDKKDAVVGSARWVEGSALPIPTTSVDFFQDLLRDLALPSIAARWLSQAGTATSLVDGLSSTRTQEHHTLGFVADEVRSAAQPIGLTPIGGSIVLDAVGAMSVTSTTQTTSDAQSAFATGVTAYDVLEGSAIEQAADTPDGGNATRLFQISNDTAALRYYEATPQNVSSVLAASTGYSNATCGPTGGSIGCGSASVNAFLYAGSPYNVVVAQKNGWMDQSQHSPPVFLQYGVSPLLAYATDGSAMAYISTYGTKGAVATSLVPDPVSSTTDTVRKSAPAKAFTAAADEDSGAVTAALAPDLVTGPGAFPHSLMHRLTYNSKSIPSYQCSEGSTPQSLTWYVNGSPTTIDYSTFTDICPPQVERRTFLGWDDNFQIDANFGNDGDRGLGQDSAVDASAAITALYVLRDLNKSPGFYNYVGTIFTAAWLQDNLSGNAVTVRHPPGSDTFVRLPDGRFNPRSGSNSALSQSGARHKDISGPGPFGNWAWYYDGIQLTDKDGGGNALVLSSNDVTSWAYAPLNRFKPDSWNFTDGTVVTFTNTLVNDPLSAFYDPVTMQTKYRRQMYVLSGVSNSLGRSLTFGNGTVTDDSSRSVSVAIAGPTSGQVTAPDQKQTLLSFARPDNFSTNASTRLSAVYLPKDHTNAYLKFNWDGLERISSTVDANGNSTSYYPASVGTLEQNVRGVVVDALNDATTSYFDDRGHLLSSTDPLGRTTTQAYDGTGRLIQTTYPELNYDKFAYDVRSNLLSTTRYPVPGSAEAIGGETIVTSTIYEEGPSAATCSNPVICNKPKAKEDARGFYTDYSWDPSSGSLTQVISGVNASGVCQLAGSSVCPEADLGYTALANVQFLNSKIEKISATASTETGYTYDSTNKFALKTTKVDVGTGKLNLLTTFAFDSIGDLLSIVSPRGSAEDSHFIWDTNNRRLVMSISPDPDGSGPLERRATKNTWDADGELTNIDRGQVSDVLQGSDFVASASEIIGYDAAGNRIQDTETAPGLTTPLNVSQLAYDADERPLCEAVRMNPAAFNALPADACTPGTQGSYGPDRIAKAIYDAAGQKRQEVRGFGTSLQQTYETSDYTANSKLKAVADSDAGLAIGSYTLDASHTYPHQTNYAYDGFDRLNLTAFADGSFEQVPYSTGYDAAGNVLTRINRAGQTLTATYDAVGRMATKSVPAVTGVSSADTITLGYDLVDEVTGLSDTLGNTLTNTYDGAQRLKTAARHAPGLSGTQKLTYQYDADGNRTTVVWPDNYCVTYSYDPANEASLAQEGAYSGSTCATSATLATFGYDTLADLVDIHYGGTLADVALSWQTNGDLLTLSHNYASSPDVSYTDVYSPSHQIGASTVSNTSYEMMIGSYTNTYAAANGLNQYTAVNGGAATGHDCFGHAEQFSYDCNGNLTSDGVLSFAYDPENHLMMAATAGMSASYAYDPLGRRNAKTVNSVATYFLDSGDDEVGEYSSTGTLLRRYIPGLAIDHPLAMIDYTQTGNPKTFFHQDKTGSVVAMSDTAGNLATGPWTYDAYGNTASSAGQPYKFDGMRLDPETNCYYDRARYYCPGIGRFLQTDPMGYGDDINWYSWGGNDPANRTDPSGKWSGWDDATFIVGGFFIGVAGQAATDLWNGKLSTPGAYLRSGAGGAVAGETLLYTGNPYLAGAAGAATTNLLNQASDNLYGRASGFNVRSFVLDTGIGTLFGFYKGPKTPLITIGRGNFNSIFKQMLTKFRTGQINRVSLRTGLKMFLGTAVKNGLLSSSAAGAIITNAIDPPPDQPQSAKDAKPSSTCVPLPSGAGGGCSSGGNY